MAHYFRYSRCYFLVFVTEDLISIELEFVSKTNSVWVSKTIISPIEQLFFLPLKISFFSDYKLNISPITDYQYIYTQIYLPAVRLVVLSTSCVFT